MLKNFDEVQERVRSIREPYIVSVAAAEDRELLLAVKAAADLGFVRPVLAGDPKAVGDICAEIGLKPLDILEAHGEEEAVSVAVKSVREGGAQVLMKGLVNTSIYMRGILNKERALCWNMYDEGIISFVTLRCLTASLDEQYDQSGRIPLSSRKRVFNFYNNSFYTRWLKNFPLVRKWSDVYFHDKIVNGYDLARGFFITQKKSLELIDEFAHSKVLTPNETAQMDILRGEIGENIEHITAVMEEMAYDYPVSYRCGVTRKSIRMLLANERRQIEQFRSEGILSASEAGSMFDDIDERHASIGSLTKTWKRNRKLNDASRGL